MMNRTLSPDVPYGTKSPGGFPRSHASSSMLPEMWQEAHELSPCPEVSMPSYRKCRPFRIVADEGSCRAMVPIVCSAVVSTRAIELLKRFRTYARFRSSRRATPVGPSPTSTALGACRDGPKMHAPDAHAPSTLNSLRDPIAVI